jgi:predicted nucleic acid-binding protein
VPLLSVEPAIADIVQAYIQHKVMPNNPVGDALHLALASYHKCDFLLTWNCKHLANANKFHHIRRVNTLLGLYVPLLVTPLELLGEEENVER